MCNDIITEFGLAMGFMIAVLTTIKLVQLRGASLVREGYASWLYHTGESRKAGSCRSQAEDGAS